MDNNDAVPNDTNRRMLVADDDPAILRLIATILEKDDYTVVAVRDGREAYKVLQMKLNLISSTPKEETISQLGLLI